MDKVKCYSLEFRTNIFKLTIGEHVFFTIEIETLNYRMPINTDFCCLMLNCKSIDHLKEKYKIIYSENISELDSKENYILMFEEEEMCLKFIDLLNSFSVMSALK